MSRDSTARVLSIGLGGGTVDGFLHAVFPKVQFSPAIVDMAKKWFGIKESYNYRIKIADGVEFLEEEAKSSKFFRLPEEIICGN